MQLSKKLLLAFTSLGLALTVSIGEADAKQAGQTQVKYNAYDYKNALDEKVMAAKQAVNKLKRDKTIKSHRVAQRAVNRIHETAGKSYAAEKKKLQKEIDIVLKNNYLR
ncbi:fibrinogen-binding protein [Mammaliicoccus sciuri]|uniref:fibrinogen-binding protein n=1 Tax=Mammaliicoccus sciuri TaxID=1296 RepID=UPI00045060B7|nr:fibrinogen-binding protein [Mammaliicoccus sciuri]EZX23009.1 hypothetical protein V070_01137 [Staphylococcus aureus C0673]MCJ1764147.1 fibrinogen-binding protein [Mammaliicoccus sciuri]MCJ1772930.1 fibrinogen-binding protein [Mammaliicoccus sciuri]